MTIAIGARLALPGTLLLLALGACGGGSDDIVGNWLPDDGRR